MPSVRSLILLSIAVFVISLAGVAIRLTRPPDSGGAGRDSFGVRRPGYRAIHDVLSELGIRSERRLSPIAPTETRQTLVLMRPDPTLTGREPVFLRDLSPWVEQGGRLVIATTGEFDHEYIGRPSKDHPLPSVIETLELRGVSIVGYSVDSQPDAEPDAAKKQRMRRDQRPLHERVSWDDLRDAMGMRATPFRTAHLVADGTLAPAANDLGDVHLRGDIAYCLDLSGEGIGIEYTGVIAVSDEDRIENDGSLEGTAAIAAEFQRGKGSIVLVTEPSLFTNEFVGKGDNSVLAARLLSPDGRPVLFDEFFHGLSVRGNALYLLTRPEYVAVLLGLLGIAAATIWRQAVVLGPELPDRLESRRDVSEYLLSMGRFFASGKRASPFLVSRVREGILRELNAEFSLPPESTDEDLLLRAIARRDPERSKQVEEVLRDYRREEIGRRHWRNTEAITAMRRLGTCLSKTR